MDAASARQSVINQIAARAGIEPTAFDSIAEAPIYEILDSLDMVELLAAVETEFGIRLEPDMFRWKSQPTVAQLTDLLTDSVLANNST